MYRLGKETQLSDPRENWHGGWGYVFMCQASDNEEVKVLQVFSRVKGIVRKKKVRSRWSEKFPNLSM